MALQNSCWICEDRVERAVTLRPQGASDGRNLCRGCMGRIIGWLAATRDPAAIQRVWPEALERPPALPGEEWREEVAQAFRESVNEALAEVDEPGRARVALGWLEMDRLKDGIASLIKVAPAALEGDAISDRLLTSLFSRLLDPRFLAAGAREALKASVGG